MARIREIHDASSSSRTKRFKTLDNDDVASSWSDLQHDVLLLVIMQLGVIDFLAFSGVCKSWRSFTHSNKAMFMASKEPMHMWISNDSSEQDSHCNLQDIKGRWFKTILPHSAGRICFGTTCGYLILFRRETRDFWLVNPITRHELHYPGYPLYVGVNVKRIKAILVFSPSISRWVFVVLHKRISFFIAGKRRWNHASSTLPAPCIVDLHAFKGKIYTLHIDCSLRELILDPKGKHRWTLVETSNTPEPCMDIWESVLVNSDESLYMVHQSPFNIFGLDFGEMRWVWGEMIERYVFFWSSVKAFAVIKPESWVDTRYDSDVHLMDDDDNKTCIFYVEKEMWYFPHECLNENVNLLDE